jgi:phage-related protein
MAEIFTWRPDMSVPATFTQRTRTAQFGSGYAQEAGDGLNTETQNWEMTFTGTKARMTEILSFLRKHQGYKAFIWETPFDGQCFFKCRSYGLTPLGAELWKLAGTFEQTFQVT